MCLVVYCVLRLLYCVVCVCIVNCVYCAIFSVTYYIPSMHVVQELFKSSIVYLVLCILCVSCIMCFVLYYMSFVYCQYRILCE